MPTTTTGSKVKKTTAPRKTTARAKKDATVPVVAEATANVEATETSKPTFKVKKDLSPTMIVTVKNGFNGTLVYKSKRTGELFIWDAFGSERGDGASGSEGREEQLQGVLHQQLVPVRRS